MLIKLRRMPVKWWLIIIRTVVDYTIVIRRHITEFLHLSGWNGPR